MNKSFLIYIIVLLWLLISTKSINAQGFDYSDEYYAYVADLSNNDPDSTLALINSQINFIHSDSIAVTGRYYRLLGLAYLYKVDYAKALDCFIASRDLFYSIDDKQGIAKALNNVSVVYSMQNLSSKSIELDQKVLAMYIEMGDSASMAGSYNNIAVGYLHMELYDKALSNFYKAVQLATISEIYEDLSMYYYNIGGIHLDAERYDSAYFYFSKSLKNTIKYDDRQGQANALCNLGEYFILTDQYQKALKVLEQSLAIAEEIQIVYEIESATEFLHQVYAHLGYYEKAYDTHKWFKQLADSANNVEVIQKIVQIEEALKHKEEIEFQKIIQEKEDLKTEISLQRQKAQRNIAYFAVLFIAIILLLLYRLYRFRVRDNDALFQQNEEITLQKEEIETQRDKIQELNHNKDKFFGIIAHDLKNPLSGIAQLSELLYDELENLTVRKRELYIKQIADSSNKAYNLLENLLQWAMVQLGRAPVDKQKVDIVNLVQDSIDLFKSNTQQKFIKVSYDKSEDVFVLADEQMVRTIIRNLFGNAVKFTPECGIIHLSLTKNDGQVQFSIKDSGIGIEEKDLPYLFDEGTSAKGIGNSKEKGNGLGLILCREFVQQNGGRIWAESQFGHGSIFYFTLPSI